MNYDLTQLIAWVRRIARDELSSVRDVFTSDGTGEITLSSTGNIILVSVTVDGTVMDPATVSVIDGVLIFNPITLAPEEAQVVAIYNNSNYTDAQVSAYLCDAAVDIGADLHIKWLVDQVGYAINYVPTCRHDHDTQTINGTVYLHPILVKLIALKGAVNVYVDKANQASDEAAIIKDGDTMIDTSKAASAAAKTLERFETNYAQELDLALIRRQDGASLDWSNSAGPDGYAGYPIEWPRSM